MRLAETSAPPKPLSRGSAGAQGARPRRHAARHETLRHGDMGRWFTSFRLYMVSTIKEGMGGAKSDYLQNHTFKSPVTRTDTRS